MSEFIERPLPDHVRSMIPTASRLRAAAKAFVVHLIVSIVIAGLAAGLVLGLWFPVPYRELAGGQHLFWILVGVDIVCGPLLTAVLFDPKKSRRELTLDLSLVALVQLVALAYGVHSISQARPVALVFEIDRLVVVSAVQVDTADLAMAPPGLGSLSWRGPVLLGTRQPKDGNETLKSIEQSLQGVEPSARPGWWQDYSLNVPEIQERMKNLADLRARRPSADHKAIDEAVEQTGLNLGELFYLPMTSRKTLDGWIILLDAEGKIVGYCEVDGF
jgi:hypothetical protein